MDAVVAIYIAVTGSIGLAVGLLAIAAFIYLMGFWSRRTHSRYGEDDWRTSWSALFRRLR